MHPWIHIFGHSLPSYGALVATAVLVCYGLSSVLGKRTPVGSDHATTIYLVGMAGAFSGTKILAWIVEGNFDLRGGGVFLGGVIGSLLCVLAASRWKKVATLDALDLMTPVGALGHMFGRLGCLAAGCCYGQPTDSSVGVLFGKDSVAYQTLRVTKPSLVVDGHTVALLPTQLFEAGFELALAGVLTWLLLRRPPRGTVIASWLLAYPVWRFIIEFYRFDPERGFLGALSTSQVLSLGLFGVGAWVMVRAILRHRQEATARPR